MKSTDESCIACFRIACKQCDWIATDEEVTLIQQEKLIACPQCGWSPSKPKS